MLKGSIVALVTPFSENGSINYEKFKELIDFQINNDTDCLLILGTTAETPTLSELERDSIVQFTIDYTKKRIPVMVGLCTNSTDAAIKLAEKYARMGADYLLALAPYYNKTNESGMYKHFMAIASAVTIPIVLYNIPSRTGCNISINVLQMLAQKDNIIGIKEASYDITHIQKVAKLCNDQFRLFSGNDDLNYLILALGGHGIITVIGNVYPELTKKMVILMDDNKFEEAHRLQRKYSDLIEKMFIETNPIPLKTLMNEMCMDVGGTRLPLDAMDDEHKRVLLESYRRIKDEH